RRLQRVLWWGVERAYLVHNPLASFRCPPVSGSPAQRERKADTAKLTQVVQTLERACSRPKS
ncbi:hypothetical protein, partial [Hymenobacter crusticola]|uniref:hypothetical protein n=1 Tax=Hymenobacter crusticola TaxID=1770526 RepID=UPI001C4F4FC5